MKKEAILEQAIAVLEELGGYFSFKSASQREYVLIGKAELEKLQQAVKEVQLAFPADRALSREQLTADDLLEKINRDIAVFQLQQEEDEMAEEPVVEEVFIEDMAQIEEEQEMSAMPPPRRVRFEPLRGDLPPELQE